MEMMNDDNETSIILNVDANMDDLKYYVGTSNILKSRNPPILSRHVSNLTMSNFNAYRHRLKKFQRWPHSLLTMWGQCMTFVMGVGNDE
jgi:predicted membrane protein